MICYGIGILYVGFVESSCLATLSVIASNVTNFMVAVGIKVVMLLLFKYYTVVVGPPCLDEIMDPIFRTWLPTTECLLFLSAYNSERISICSF